jgi:hypothetical protein
MVNNAADAVETANPFVQGAISFTDTWGPVLKKLEAFQSIGTHLSEIHPYAKMAWSILNFIPMVNLFHSKSLAADEDM